MNAERLLASRGRKLLKSATKKGTKGSPSQADAVDPIACKDRAASRFLHVLTILGTARSAFEAATQREQSNLACAASSQRAPQSLDSRRVSVMLATAARERHAGFHTLKNIRL